MSAVTNEVWAAYNLFVDLLKGAFGVLEHPMHYVRSMTIMGALGLLAGLVAYGLWWLCGDVAVIALFFGQAHYWVAVRLVMGGVAAMLLLLMVIDLARCYLGDHDNVKIDMHALAHVGGLVGLVWLTTVAPTFLYGLVS